MIIKQPEPMNFLLQCRAPDQTEILLFKQNGEIYVHGKLVTNDLEVVEGFRDFLATHAAERVRLQSRIETLESVAKEMLNAFGAPGACDPRECLFGCEWCERTVAATKAMRDALPG